MKENLFPCWIIQSLFLKRSKGIVTHYTNGCDHLSTATSLIRRN